MILEKSIQKRGPNNHIFYERHVLSENMFDFRSPQIIRVDTATCFRPKGRKHNFQIKQKKRDSWFHVNRTYVLCFPKTSITGPSPSDIPIFHRIIPQWLCEFLILLPEQISITRYWFQSFYFHPYLIGEDSHFD